MSMTRELKDRQITTGAIRTQERQETFDTVKGVTDSAWREEVASVRAPTAMAKQEGDGMVRSTLKRTVHAYRAIGLSASR
ncbi:hypothetical protein SNOG_15250 [Parastagonospora nodorum SN15]|uniref:Uncharacterized protein n=1 Tax=Phaeosphaeria nodorum (strain SN15 / ATCC MYA-4574 / FGSC 10173) TaxID=321614 RepID=Q0TZB8_PHANO|nr:hypothetical protein SNOG_15250 [Parastagonospora nodorum SN15]KAH4092754.1 hypothetical protein HBH46_180770 [Parastagonospora nodorum]EAT77475.1 hypothetical protein SNOG_15250 [Parastagonospora nodorum SN15]KAH4128481.1 hypothetical protein HBH45_209810 [Parastagonospora nodorum]KAH4149090.1 hypothetical protein HBH44_198900 [Parastagonospora nodorum]KAH4484907.1 hypothetical protein HBH89_220690 [Parastagonospora nodorum]